MTQVSSLTGGIHSAGSGDDLFPCLLQLQRLLTLPGSWPLPFSKARPLLVSSSSQTQTLVPSYWDLVVTSDSPG